MIQVRTPAKLPFGGKIHEGGRPPTSGLQDPGTRAKLLVEKHGAAVVLRALRDEKYLCENFSTYDGMIIMGIGHALKGSGDERERMFNRMFGKVPDKTINLNVNVDVDPTRLTARAQEMLARIAGTDDENE